MQTRPFLPINSVSPTPVQVEYSTPFFSIFSNVITHSTLRHHCAGNKSDTEQRTAEDVSFCT